MKSPQIHLNYSKTFQISFDSPDLSDSHLQAALSAIMEDDNDVDTMEDAEQAEAAAVKRAAELGFRPQKEHAYNKLLPYAGDKFDAESSAWFAEIKANLTLSLANREIRPGFDTWSGRLNA